MTKPEHVSVEEEGTRPRKANARGAGEREEEGARVEREVDEPSGSGRGQE